MKIGREIHDVEATTMPSSDLHINYDDLDEEEIDR